MARTGRYLTIVQTEDVALNDSDKSFVVPAATQWALKSVYAKIIATATGGNRQIDLLLTDAADAAVAIYKAGAVVTAGLTREFVFAPLHPQETTFTGQVQLRALGHDLVLPAGYKLRVYDSAAIDAAADDLTVRFLVELLTE